MDPPPPAAKFSVPAPKKVKENEDGGGVEGVGANMAPPSVQTPLADNTPNSRGEVKKSELVAATEGGASLPPPPPKKSGASAGKNSAGVSKDGRYKPPGWGLTVPPEASGLSLTVLKGGIEVSSISLDNRTHILLGELIFDALCASDVGFPHLKLAGSQQDSEEDGQVCASAAAAVLQGALADVQSCLAT